MILLVGLVALAACQNVDGDATADQIGALPGATSSQDYPSLHSVPPRPRLTYSVQQRRAIVDGLIGDRENARYTDQVVRYRTGRSSLPPPPAPPVVAAVEPEVPAGAAASPPDAAAPPEPEVLDPGSVYRDDPDDNTLDDFVDELVRGTAQEPAAEGSDAGAAAPAGGGWFGWLRGLFGQADPPAPRTPAAEPPVAEPPVAKPPAAAAARSRTAAPAEAPRVSAVAPADAEAALAALMANAAVQPAMARARGERGDDGSAATTARTSAPAAGPLRSAAADQVGQPPAASGEALPLRPQPGDVGIAIGDGEVAIEVAAPTKVEPPAAPRPSVARPPAVGRVAARPSGAGRGAHDSATVAGRIAFAPGSAALPAGVGPQLAQVLAMARAQGARIRIVGEAEAEAGALALDRARAVALALIRVGAKPHELEMTLARDATGDQARLLLAADAIR